MDNNQTPYFPMKLLLLKSMKFVITVKQRFVWNYECCCILSIHN